MYAVDLQEDQQMQVRRRLAYDRMTAKQMAPLAAKTVRRGLKQANSFNVLL